jgi:hypothetical protein
MLRSNEKHHHQRSAGTRPQEHYSNASGATGAMTTIEYESGLISRLKDVLERIAPQNTRVCAQPEVMRW